ncbi:nuclear transport factor 2 family protein [Oceanicola sp. 502str15]|uniref:nuclear transport factor 2 family protein n=1 Tax=Oceanicola sp. 502str15 TaxID=2696061 RepID=UPI0020941CDF|nr:nuclear transport factor 2 family protein [Oceanicola sp. 502str15]MCO6381770.1 nuclear transport factor 2 family protein [Oceanicola sp. 502str15]
MPSDELERTLRELKDRQDIHDCLMRYSRGVDRLDRELILSVYHDDAVDDHGVFVGGPEAFADWVIDMHSRTHMSHQHCIFNVSVDLDGEVAHTESYYMFVGMNRDGKPLAQSGGRYLDRLEKRNGRWAIADRVCLRDWAPLEAIPASLDQSSMTAVKNLPDGVKRLMQEGPQTSRDRSDPSYSRPLAVDRARVATFARTVDSSRR